MNDSLLTPQALIPALYYPYAVSWCFTNFYLTFFICLDYRKIVLSEVVIVKNLYVLNLLIKKKIFFIITKIFKS